MKMTASLLAFALGLGLLGTYVAMNRTDGLNAAANIARGYQELHDGNELAFNNDIQEMKERHSDERNYGLAGVVALIGGFALWPKKNTVATA